MSIAGRCGSVLFLSITFLVTFYIHITGARRYRSCEEGCCIHEYCAYHRICYPKIHCRFGCPDGTCVGEEDKANTKDSGTNRRSSPSPGFSPMRVFTNSKGPGGYSELVKNTSHRDKTITLAQTKSMPATPLKSPFLQEERYFGEHNEIAPLSKSTASPGAHNQIFAHVSKKSDDVLGSGARPNSLSAQQGAGLEQTLQSDKIPIAKEIARELPGNNGICMPTPPCKPRDDCGMGHVCAFNYNLGYPTCQYNLEIGSTLCYDRYGQLNLQTSS